MLRPRYFDSRQGSAFLDSIPDGRKKIVKEKRPWRPPNNNKYSVYLLYWYKSTNTDASLGFSSAEEEEEVYDGQADERVSSRILTYPHVSSRMLTRYAAYADVC